MAPPAAFADYPEAKEGPDIKYNPKIEQNPVFRGIPLVIGATLWVLIPSASSSSCD